MEPAVRKAGAGAVGGPGIDLLVGVDNRTATLRAADTVADVGDEFLQSADLRLGGGFAIEITDETNADGDVVEVVAGNMPAVDLALPPVADLDLTVTGAMAVADDEVVGKPVDHMAYTAMVDVENARVPLPRAAVVDHDVFPAATFHRGPVDGIAQGGTEVGVGFTGSEQPAPEALVRGFRGGNRLESLLDLGTRLLNGDRCRGARSMGQG